MMRTVYSPELADFGAYELELTIIYTQGKDGNWWPSDISGDHTAGVTSGAFLDSQNKKAAGAALIDLRATLPRGTGSQRMATGKAELKPPSFNEYRYSTFRTLAHEMFHFIQHWRAGDKLEDGDIHSPFSKAYSETYHAIRRMVQRERPDWPKSLIADAAHAKHPREKEAEQFANGRLPKYRKVINEGVWDVCVPIEDMKRIYGG